MQIGRTRRHRHIPRRREAIFRLACRIHWTIRETTYRIDGLQVGKTTASSITAVDGAGGLFGTVTQDMSVKNLLISPAGGPDEGECRCFDWCGDAGNGFPGTTNRATVKIKMQIEYPQVQAEQTYWLAGALVGHI